MMMKVNSERSRGLLVREALVPVGWVESSVGQAQRGSKLDRVSGKSSGAGRPLQAPWT